MCKNINSKKNNPFFNNSLLDGFAFKSSDTVSNKSFKILGATSAGQKNKIKYKKIVVIELVQAQRYFIHMTV